MNQYWTPIAHACELATEGDFVVLPVGHGGGDIAVMRQDGMLVAWNNACPHRGARIFDEMSGNRPAVCRYHGRCAKAAQLPRLPIQQHGGFVFVASATMPAPPPMVALAEPADLGRFLDGTGGLRLHSTLRFTMDAHWTVAVENALDNEHIEPVHGASLAKLALRSEETVLYRSGASFERFRSESGRLGHMARFFPGEARFDYCHAHLHPYAALSSTRGWTYSLQHYLPRADGKTDFLHRLYAAPTTRALPEFFESVRKLNEQIFREDAVICALVAPWHNGRLVERERRIAHFRAALDDHKPVLLRRRSDVR